MVRLLASVTRKNLLFVTDQRFVVVYDDNARPVEQLLQEIAHRFVSFVPVCVF